MFAAVSAAREKELFATNATKQESSGETRLEYILGVPLADKVVRQWPQMGEIVRTRRLIADVEGNFQGSRWRSAGVCC